MPGKGKGWPLVVVAIVGLAIGFAASSFAYRHRWLGVSHEPFIERMQHQLNLTPAQHDQILQIVNETRSKVMNLRQEFQRQRHEQMRQARARVRALLTPEQQEKFDREFKPRPDRDHGGGPGMHEGEGPPHGPHEGAPHGGDGPPS
ncbi:MAG: Spy/CpxP family protein refolding chaperone [Candidatus Binataceae bacterium]